ncbi:hypothetical protein RFI_20806 [Reticulomyxa filosa]|uniref:Serine carboxypeptidase n=1 Tax=Reticulomyxa filosa TaxID=46433 RepID=X6MRA6_RETFI|nr:hypothetical protein RFI_20806 [Reticulomyxa filosa]|eukprot:ETO16533.1 hypothetical protein RFI_20806 [Reticulomyxa filosa]
MYTYGIISPPQYEYLLSGNCSTWNLSQPGCEEQSDAFTAKYLNDINKYDINVDFNCSGRSWQEESLLRHAYKSKSFENDLDRLNIWAHPYPPCNSKYMVEYLNQPEVWDAFHVNLDWVQMPSNSQKEYMNLKNLSWFACAHSYWNGYDQNETMENQIPYYVNILTNSDIRILVFSGKYHSSFQSWHVLGEVAGWFQEWEKFVFVNVRDAGHEVPEYQPARAYVLFQRFLNGISIADKNNNMDDAQKELPPQTDDNLQTLLYGYSDTIGNFWGGFAVGAGVIAMLAFIAFASYWWLIKRKRDERYDQFQIMSDFTTEAEMGTVAHQRD